MPKRKLLLADDSVTIQKVVNLTFADEGIEVISVGDGNAALEILNSERPDIVLADVNMPGPTGYEICEKIRANAELANIPVLLLVGSFEQFDNDESKRVGANGHITKPFQSIRQLVAEVTDLLNNQNGADTQTNNIGAGSDDESLRSTKTDTFDVGMDDELIDEFAPYANEAEQTPAQEYQDDIFEETSVEPDDTIETAENLTVPSWAMPVSQESDETTPEQEFETLDIGSSDKDNSTQYHYSEFGSTFKSPINKGNSDEYDPLEAETKDLSQIEIGHDETETSFETSSFSTATNEYDDSLHVTESLDLSDQNADDLKTGFTFAKDDQTSSNFKVAEAADDVSYDTLAYINRVNESVDPHAITKEIVIDESDLLELPTLPDEDLQLVSTSEAVEIAKVGQQEKVERVVTLSDSLIEMIADRVIEKLRQKEGF